MRYLTSVAFITPECSWLEERWLPAAHRLYFQFRVLLACVTFITPKSEFHRGDFWNSNSANIFMVIVATNGQFCPQRCSRGEHREKLWDGELEFPETIPALVSIVPIAVSRFTPDSTPSQYQIAIRRIISIFRVRSYSRWSKIIYLRLSLLKE